ncbi:MAG TPA: beta family protein [Gammaproteobacteria bacterium]
MFSESHYLAALKGKAGEFEALTNLPSDVKDFVIPLIDVPRRPSSEKNVDVARDLKKVADGIYESWGGELPVLLDVFDLHPDTRTSDMQHPVEYLFSAARSLGLRAVPVAGLDRDDSHLEAVRSVIAEDGRGVVVRLLYEDIEFPDELPDQVEQLLDRIDVQVQEVDFVLDFRSIRALDLARVERLAIDAIVALVTLGGSRSLGIVASSLPQSIAEEISKGGSGFVGREEVRLVGNIRAGVAWLGICPTYGDYATVHPEFVDNDPRIYSNTMGPKIIYTTPQQWFVTRGEAFRKHPLAYKQYYNLADEIRKRPEYLGATYSYGDDYIDKKGGGQPGPGNPTKWLTASINHHAVFVTRHVMNGLLV